MIIVKAAERGVTIRDWQDLTFGMILGVIIAYNNLHYDEEADLKDDTGGRVRLATQEDFDCF
jgi:hypothetical protein